VVVTFQRRPGPRGRDTLSGFSTQDLGSAE
jgi:hypothetical protein